LRKNSLSDPSTFWNAKNITHVLYQQAVFVGNQWMHGDRRQKIEFFGHDSIKVGCFTSKPHNVWSVMCKILFTRIIWLCRNRCASHGLVSDQWWAVINYFLVNYVIKLLWSSWLQKFNYSKVTGDWVVVKLLFKVVNYQVIKLLKCSWRSFCCWFLSVYLGLCNRYSLLTDYYCFAQVR